MKAKRRIESSLNSVTMLDGTGGHVRRIPGDNRDRGTQSVGGWTPKACARFGTGLGWVASRWTPGELAAGADEECAKEDHAVEMI